MKYKWNDTDGLQNGVGTVYVIQALLDITPNYPRWADLQFHSLPLWREYKYHPDRVTGHVFAQPWTDVLAFWSVDAGREALAAMQQAPVEAWPEWAARKSRAVMRLRLVERCLIRTEGVVGE